MSKLPELTLTKAGAAMLAKTPIGSEIPVTKWRIGTGKLPDGEDPRDRTQLVAPLRELPIAGVENKENRCLIKCQLVNTEMDAFTWRETGLYATDPDDGEILYAYGYEADGPEIPAGATQLREVVFGVNLVFDTAANVTAVISKTLVFATLDDLDKKIDKLPSATTGHIPVVAASGGLSDSGLTPCMAGVRQNLLYNWYFVGNGVAPSLPVNQRGGSTWNTPAIFMFDRWKNGREGSVITLSGQYVTLNGLGDMFQWIPGQNLLGKTVCFSVLTSNGLCFGSRELPASVPQEPDNVLVYQDASINLAIGVTTQGYVQVSILSTNNQANQVIAAKLEIGTTQSLAYQQSGGSWVVLGIPDYTEEFLRCAKYYERLTWCTGYGVAEDASTVLITNTAYFASRKRIAPTVTVNPEMLPLEILDCETMQGVSDCVLVPPLAVNAFVVSPKITGTFTVGHLYRVTVRDYSYIADAELA